MRAMYKGNFTVQQFQQEKKNKEELLIARK